MAPGEIHVRTFVINFMKKELDNFLHRNAEVAEAILKKIQRAERERKDLQGIRKLARERAKKASLHNKKLRDCRCTLNDKKASPKGDRRLETTSLLPRGTVHLDRSLRVVM
jgi:topoisomerase-4 subunit B